MPMNVLIKVRKNVIFVYVVTRMIHNLLCAFFVFLGKTAKNFKKILLDYNFFFFFKFIAQPLILLCFFGSEIKIRLKFLKNSYSNHHRPLSGYEGLQIWLKLFFLITFQMVYNMLGCSEKSDMGGNYKLTL